MNKVKLPFEDTVRLFLGNVFDDKINKISRGDLSIFNHFIEASPDQGSAEDIFNFI